MKILVTKNEMIKMGEVAAKSTFLIEDVTFEIENNFKDLDMSTMNEMCDELYELRNGLRQEIAKAKDSDEEILTIEIPEETMLDAVKKIEQVDAIVTEGAIEIIRFIGRNKKRIKMLADYTKASFNFWCENLMKQFTPEENIENEKFNRKMDKIIAKVKRIVNTNKETNK